MVHMNKNTSISNKSKGVEILTGEKLSTEMLKNYMKTQVKLQANPQARIQSKIKEQKKLW